MTTGEPVRLTSSSVWIRVMSEVSAALARYPALLLNRLSALSSLLASQGFAFVSVARTFFDRYSAKADCALTPPPLSLRLSLLFRSLTRAVSWAKLLLKSSRWLSAMALLFGSITGRSVTTLASA